ncbi:MAG TPA: hypothetical protein VFM90_04915 [Cyclobacteriaceae bacterium]|nr:hypothetical protein [Cyclobacteriaceae bacterium]
MKNQTFIHSLRSMMPVLFIVAASLLAGCSDDPVSANEEEVITTFTVTLTLFDNPAPQPGDTIRLTWDDANLDALVDVSEVSASGPLRANETYRASIQMLSKGIGSEVDITEEIAEEADEHIFCFSKANVNIAITNPDTDTHKRPLGLTSTWTTTTASAGTVTITLRHQPGVKTGDCPGAGETDASITFPVEVAAGE